MTERKMIERTCTNCGKTFFSTAYNIKYCPECAVEIRRKQKIETVKKSIKKNCVQYSLKLSKNTDADIIQRLGEVPTKLGYIKKLIRKDIEEQKKTEE